MKLATRDPCVLWVDVHDIFFIDTTYGFQSYVPCSKMFYMYIQIESDCVSDSFQFSIYLKKTLHMKSM